MSAYVGLCPGALGRGSRAGWSVSDSTRRRSPFSGSAPLQLGGPVSTRARAFLFCRGPLAADRPDYKPPFYWLGVSLVFIYGMFFTRSPRLGCPMIADRSCTRQGGYRPMRERSAGRPGLKSYKGTKSRAVPRPRSRLTGCRDCQPPTLCPGPATRNRPVLGAFRLCAALSASGSAGRIASGAFVMT